MYKGPRVAEKKSTM